MVRRGPAATPRRRTFHPARLSRAALSAMKFAMAPPDVIIPPAPSGNPNTSCANHRVRASSISVAAGPRRHPPTFAFRPAAKQVGRRARHRAGAGDVRHEARMPAVGGPVERHLAQVREERGVVHRLVGDGQRHGVVHLLGRPSAGDRHGGQPLQQLLPDVRRRIRERAGTRGSQSSSRMGAGRSTITRPPRRAGSTPPSSRAGRCPGRTPPPWRPPGSRGPGWPGASARAPPGGSVKSMLSSLAGRDRRRAGAEDVEPVVEGHELGRPLRRVGGVVHLRARPGRPPRARASPTR